MAAALAQRLNLGHIEVDAHFHLEDWSHPSEADFRSSLSTAMDSFDSSHGGWVACGNYGSKVGDLRRERCDTIVWLDLPKPVVITRLVRRTLRRAVLREHLWNGNREPLGNFLSRDPDKNVILWSWTRFAKVRLQYETAMNDGSWAHLEVHRLGTRAQADAFLAAL